MSCGRWPRRPMAASPRRPVPERRRLREPPQHAERRICACRRAGPAAGAAALLPGAELGSAGSEHAHALEVLAELLGGGATSRLYRSLVRRARRRRRGRLASIAAPASMRTNFRIYAAPRPGIDIDQLEAALDEEIERLLEGWRHRGVARAQRQMTGRGHLCPGFAERCGAHLRLGADHGPPRSTTSRAGPSGSRP